MTLDPRLPIVAESESGTSFVCYAAASNHPKLHLEIMEKFVSLNACKVHASKLQTVSGYERDRVADRTLERAIHNRKMFMEGDS